MTLIMHNDNMVSPLNIAITGATSGIGLATAVGLAARGCRVIGIGRSQERCDSAKLHILEEYPDAKIDYITTDLSLMRNVALLAEEILESLNALPPEERRLDALVNNAGTFRSWYTCTDEGNETQFAVNHLAPFLLTMRLLPVLAASARGRAITVSSGSHRHTRMAWNDIMMRGLYNSLWAYKRSKLANVLFSYEFNRRMVMSGSRVKAYAADPGLVNTDIGLKGTNSIVRKFWSMRMKHGIKPEKAAETLIHLCIEPILKDEDAVYWCQSKPCIPSKYSMSIDAARRLWEISRKLCARWLL